MPTSNMNFMSLFCSVLMSVVANTSANCGGSVRGIHPADEIGTAQCLGFELMDRCFDMQAHESLAHAPLENIRLQLSQVSLQRKAAQFGQSVRYQRDSCHSLLHAPTGSINLDNSVSLERTSRGIRRTSNALARRSIMERTVFNHEPAISNQLEFPPPSAVVHVTAGQRQGSISLAVTSTVAESSMELPEPAATINPGSARDVGSTCNRGMPEPKHFARKHGILPVWRYLFISTSPAPRRFQHVLELRFHVLSSGVPKSTPVFSVRTAQKPDTCVLLSVLCA